MIHTTLTVFCDYPGCGQWEYLTEIKKRQARRQTVSRGWKPTKGGKYLCPQCKLKPHPPDERKSR